MHFLLWLLFSFKWCRLEKKRPFERVEVECWFPYGGRRKHPSNNKSEQESFVIAHANISPTCHLQATRWCETWCKCYASNQNVGRKNIAAIFDDIHDSLLTYLTVSYYSFVMIIHTSELTRPQQNSIIAILLLTNVFGSDWCVFVKHFFYSQFISVVHSYTAPCNRYLVQVYTNLKIKWHSAVFLGT